ncbi:hypothetical protein BC349_03240 [Flavihumibacter stibioxidans]|uniref:Uncharacterized protein n=1 Tax=Flavihumibacter stibioxidans TaxID=1834163 RepID=A0ABR7M5U2_9BACT|nr:hypothetical protein [Flavihumibacter stibioxidans]
MDHKITAFWDNYVKFICYGSDKKSEIAPDNFPSINKIGNAWYFLTGMAWAVYKFEPGPGGTRSQIQLNSVSSGKNDNMI